MKKNTAVEWLEDKLIDSGINFLTEEVEFIEQAKEMFEQQIIDAWNDAIYCNTIGNEINYEDGEQYYQETFKSE